MAQWMIKEETANRLILEKGSFWWRKKIQIDVDVSSDIVSITKNQQGKGTTNLSYAGIRKILLLEDRYEWIVAIRDEKGKMSQVEVCWDSDRTKMSKVAEIFARFLKKRVDYPFF